MIDFQPVRDRTRTVQDLSAGLTKPDLAAALTALYDDVGRRLLGLTDAEVTFTPVDETANDTFATDASEVGLAWTLGHVVVHLTASAEEGAFIAAELARGVAREGRSRWETPWETVTTATEATARLDESRRMILATLDVWPDSPHLDVTLDGGAGPRNALARFVGGLSHADSHLAQLSEIRRQAGATPEPPGRA